MTQFPTSGGLRIGLTYDLKTDYLAEGFSEEAAAEFDSEATVAGLAEAIARKGHTPMRIGHVRALTQRLAAGERYGLVFNIAEGVSGFGREAQVPALLDAYGIPYTFADPLTATLTLHKGVCKRVLRDAGLPTAPFAVVEQAEDATRVDLPTPLFAKPVAEGTSKGVEPACRVQSSVALGHVCADLLARFNQPVLVETYLPGREVTVCLLGTGEAARVLGVMDVGITADGEADIYTYNNKEAYETHVSYRLADPDEDETRAAGELALAAWKLLGCRDGGRVDLRQDAAGVWNVLELNPLPGLHPVRSDLPICGSLLGMDYNQLIGEILDSALTRVIPRQELATCA